VTKAKSSGYVISWLPLVRFHKFVHGNAQWTVTKRCPATSDVKNTFFVPCYYTSQRHKIQMISF